MPPPAGAGDLHTGGKRHATGPSPPCVAAADLDGDGDLDLVSANLDSRTLTLLFGGK